MIKEFKTGKMKGLFVEVPVDAYDFYLLEACNRSNQYGLFWFDGTSNPKYEANLPLGSYTFLFTTIAATEEDAREVVDEYGDWAYKNYNKIIRTMTQSSAVSSLHSLLTSLGLDVTKNYAVLKINE